MIAAQGAYYVTLRDMPEAQVLSVQPHKLLGLVGQGQPIERLVLSSERGLLASATHDDAVRLWDVRWLLESGDSDDEEEGDDGNDEDLVRNADRSQMH